MARKAKRKGTSGAAVAFISRKQALKKLQLALKDFRRLCILKGIYPVEPNNKKKVNHGSAAVRTYYLLKDIQFLAHEPIINKFRELKIFIRRIKKAIAKGDRGRQEIIKRNWPDYQLDHLVKERYPTFLDAVRDLDDSLAMCFLISTFPKTKCIKSDLVDLCRRLTIEFMHYVIESKSLRKVFISIKGYYYQANILGQPVTWIVPHPRGFEPATDVDFKVMVSFTEFYATMLGFVNFKLYQALNLFYPPKLTVEEPTVIVNDENSEDLVSEWVSALNRELKSSSLKEEEDAVEIDEFLESDEKLKEAWREADKVKNLEKLFKGLKFFLNREVPRESLVFIIRAFGGEVSWDNAIHAGATYDDKNEFITHHIVDRPRIDKQYLNRYYIQPQWVYDSINATLLLPVQDYFVGVPLPPHLSPFVVEKEGEYVPPEKVALQILQSKKGHTSEEIAIDLSDLEDNHVAGSPPRKKQKCLTTSGIPKVKKIIPLEPDKKPKMRVMAGQEEDLDVERMRIKQVEEEKRLAIMMIPKKQKRLYKKIQYGKRRKIREADALRVKRQQHDLRVLKDS